MTGTTSGDLTAATCHQLRRVAGEQCTRWPRMVADLTGVGLLDGDGLRVLAGVMALTVRQGGTFGVVALIGTQPYERLATCALLEAMRVRGSVAQALEAVTVAAGEKKET